MTDRQPVPLRITGTLCVLLLVVASGSRPSRASNALMDSAAFERWTTFRGAHVAADAGSAPDGSATADQLHDSTTENGARIYSNTVTAEGGPYVFSCYLKAGALRQAKLTIADGNGSSVRAYAQPSLGADWQRYVVLLGATTAGSTLRVELYPGKFDKETGYVWAWGAQLERGSAPTPYAPAMEGGGPTPDTTPPAVPTGLSAQVSSDSAQVRWTPNTEGDLAGYRLQRSPDGMVFTGVAEPQAAEFVDRTVAPGGSYHYRVAAVDAGGNASAYSAAVSVTMPPASEPPSSAQTNLIHYPEDFEKWGSFREARATRNAGAAPNGGATADHVVDSLTLNGAHLFSNSVTSEAGAYTLSCYLRAGTLGKAKLALFDASSGSVYSYVEPTLSNGWQRYSCTAPNLPKGSLLRAGIYAGKFDKESGYVWAWGAQLERGLTATAYVPVDVTPPTAPTGLTTRLLNDAVQLQWTANLESDLAGYRVERGVNSTVTFNPLASPTTPEHSDGAIEIGNSYSYRVRAVDDAGNVSEPSAVATETWPLPDTTPPRAPTGLTGQLSGGEIQVRWNANTEADLAGYRLDRGVNSTTSFSVAASPTEPSYVDAAVAPGNSYTYRVYALDLVGNVSPASELLTVEAPLPAPTSVNVLDFGANRDPEGDDTNAIQAAFDAAVDRDLDVLLPEGFYWISRTLDFRASGRAVRGEGMNRTTLAGDTNLYNLLRLDRTQGAAIRDLRLEGSHLNDDAVNVNRAVECLGASGSLIQRVHAYGAGYLASDNAATGTIIEDCVIEDYGRIGYLANDGARVRRCRFICAENWSFTGEMQGVYASAGRSDILIEDNEFINCGSYAIQLWGSQSGVWTENVLIQRNTFTRCKNVLVVGAGSSGPSYRSVRFLANTVRESEEKDIRIMKFNGSTADGTELLVQDNLFEDPGQAYGFLVVNHGGSPITGVRIRNNRFLSPNRSSYHGLLHFQAVEGPLADVVVEGNLFQDFGHSGTLEKPFPAIWLRSGADITLQDNTFVHWPSAGAFQDVEAVRFDSEAVNISVTRNLFTGTGLARCYGVRVTAPGSAVNGNITNNEFSGAKLEANGVPEVGNIIR